MERSIRQDREHAALIEKEERVAKARGLCPIVPVSELVTGDYAVARHYLSKDFALGGTGASFFAINAQRPACGIRLFPALNTYRGHSSGVEGQYRRWQVVHPKPHIVPEGFLPPPSTRWIVVWIGLVVDEQGAHLVEPVIFIAPFIPVSKTKNKVAPFIIECGPGDFSAEKCVQPRHQRDTHVNGFLSRLFGIFFGQWKLMALLRWFPCAPVPEPAPAPAPLPPPETPAPAVLAPLPLTTPSPPPPPSPSPAAGRRPPTFNRSSTASSYGLRKKSPLTKEQTELLEEAGEWQRRAESAEAAVEQLKQKIKNDKKAAERRKTPKAKQERLPARPGRKYLEEHLEDFYETKKVKWFVSPLL